MVTTRRLGQCLNRAFPLIAVVLGAIAIFTLGYEIARQSWRRDVTATIQSIERVKGAKSPDWFLLRTDGPTIAVADDPWSSRRAQKVVNGLKVGEGRKFHVIGFDGSWHGVHLTYVDSSLVDADQ